MSATDGPDRAPAQLSSLAKDGPIPPDILCLARRHRAVMLVWQAIGLQWACIGVFLLLITGDTRIDARIVFVQLIAVCASGLVALAVLVRLRLALGDFAPVAVIYSFASTLPFLNLITVPLVANEALPWLRPHFGRVGLFGLSTHAIRLADSTRCARCGYDLRGLAERKCPECGTSVPPSVASPAAIDDQ